MTHPDVSLAAVIGVPHDSHGEEVKAVVIRAEGATITEDELVAWGKVQMAAYKYPRIVEFVDALPMTATGKSSSVSLAESYGIVPHREKHTPLIESRDLSMDKCIAPASEVPVGTVSGFDGIVVGNNGEHFAVSRRCRHLGADLAVGAVDPAGCLVCPWHGAAYDVESGRMVRVGGPGGVFAKVPGLRGHLQSHDSRGAVAAPSRR